MSDKEREMEGYLPTEGMGIHEVHAMAIRLHAENVRLTAERDKPITFSDAAVDELVFCYEKSSGIYGAGRIAGKLALEAALAVHNKEREK